MWHVKKTKHIQLKSQEITEEELQKLRTEEKKLLTIIMKNLRIDRTFKTLFKVPVSAFGELYILDRHAIE